MNVDLDPKVVDDTSRGWAFDHRFEELWMWESGVSSRDWEIGRARGRR